MRLHEVDLVDDDDLRQQRVSGGVSVACVHGISLSPKAANWCCAYISKLQLVGQQVDHASFVVVRALPVALFERVALAPVVQHAGAVDNSDLHSVSVGGSGDWSAAACHRVQEGVVDQGAAVALVDEGERLRHLRQSERDDTALRERRGRLG